MHTIKQGQNFHLCLSQLERKKKIERERERYRGGRRKRRRLPDCVKQQITGSDFPLRRLRSQRQDRAGFRTQGWRPLIGNAALLMSGWSAVSMLSLPRLLWLIHWYSLIGSDQCAVLMSWRLHARPWKSHRESLLPRFSPCRTLCNSRVHSRVDCYFLVR